MNVSSRFAFSAVLAAAFLAGCASDVKLDDKAAPVETRDAGTGNSNAAGAATRGTSPTQVASVDLSKTVDASKANLPRVVYFDFDSFVLKDEFRPAVEAQAKALSSDRKKKVVIEGHTDERGGSEYNLALGQKRAETVVKALTLLGATDTQVEAVSFGKERLAVQGSDEAAHAKNRRAELNNR